MNILVLHASRDGQAAAIAQRIARVLEASGNHLEVLPIDTPSLPADLAECDFVVVGAGVRFGRHGGVFERIVRGHRDALSAKANAFFSVSLAMAGDAPRRDEARKYVDGMIARTGWHPDRTVLFAGALRYTAYNPVIRWVMRRIADGDYSVEVPFGDGGRVKHGADGGRRSARAERQSAHRVLQPGRRQCSVGRRNPCRAVLPRGGVGVAGGRIQ